MDFKGNYPMNRSIIARLRVWRGVTILIAAAVGATGCQTARVADPLTRTLGGSDPDQQMDFLHTLADRPVTSNDEALHGLVLFLDGTDPYADYAARVAAL